MGSLANIYLQRIKMKSKGLSWDNKEALEMARHALAQGKLLVGASDTVPGFLSPLTKDGFEQLNTIKNRSQKPYLVLIGSQEKIANFVDTPVSPLVASLIEHCWPGPLTLILQAKSNIPSFVTSQQGAIALRMPDHQGLLYLLQDVDGLFSSSANKAALALASLELP